MIDEFIYQYQSFSHYASKLKNKSEEEIAALKAATGVWDTQAVLKSLESLVARSDIVEHLNKLEA